MVRWLKVCTANAEGMGLIPGWGTKILYATQCGQKIKKNTLLFLQETVTSNSSLL